VSLTRPAATEFHLQNSGGFPPGTYRVDVLINGQPAGTREFRVEP
jgi:outer membrane usher protein FimD/PapC